MSFVLPLLVQAKSRQRHCLILVLLEQRLSGLLLLVIPDRRNEARPGLCFTPSGKAAIGMSSCLFGDLTKFLWLTGTTVRKSCYSDAVE